MVNTSHERRKKKWEKAAQAAWQAEIEFVIIGLVVIFSHVSWSPNFCHNIANLGANRVGRCYLWKRNRNKNPKRRSHAQGICSIASTKFFHSMFWRKKKNETGLEL